ncbi:TfoX/Sxy family protein [Mucilaginibacter sp. HMF5004]|uniref:TfoX/Sxy family protein n=1 Tax=Mucilaginibacter rivuli TaxID=2857527 RepID=UPI001C5D7F07|nr:TfoX/Sxy family protein [Mucilaginibacter rivuli]MBW4889062.1 TfoX/Sxy family protein [Mucilaginibacter rivuli]
MAYDHHLADRLREALMDLPNVEEKKMFSGVTFMVDGKMCICVSHDNLLCRIGPDKFEEALEMNGCQAMIMKGKTMKGYVYVNPEGFNTKKELDYWINLCIAYNSQAKPTKKKKAKNTD